MRTHLVLTGVLIAGGMIVSSRDLPAQQVTVTTPFQSVGERFFESTNVHWSFGDGRTVFARFGNPGAGAPPFGGFNPNAGLRTGFAAGGGGFHAGMGFNFAQGAQRTHITTAPVLTLTNGQPGSLFFGRQVPFVTGVVPVVGSAGGFGGPALMRSPTIATRVLRGEVSLPPAGAFRPHVAGKQTAATAPAITVPTSPSERRQAQQAEQAADQLKAREYLEHARNAEQKGKPQVALQFYRLAARKAAGPLRLEAEERLADLQHK